MKLLLAFLFCHTGHTVISSCLDFTVLPLLSTYLLLLWPDTFCVGFFDRQKSSEQLPRRGRIFSKLTCRNINKLAKKASVFFF